MESVENAWQLQALAGVCLWIYEIWKPFRQGKEGMTVHSMCTIGLSPPFPAPFHTTQPCHSSTVTAVTHSLRLSVAASTQIQMCRRVHLHTGTQMKRGIKRWISVRSENWVAPAYFNKIDREQRSEKLSNGLLFDVSGCPRREGIPCEFSCYLFSRI